MSTGVPEYLQLAEEYASSAQDNLTRDPQRLSVAFAEARHAAELAGKCLLLLAQGTFPAKHTIAGDMHKAGVVPQELDPRRLDRLFRAFTRGEYGVMDAPLGHEVEEALEISGGLIAAVHAWPDGPFHAIPSNR